VRPLFPCPGAVAAGGRAPFAHSLIEGNYVCQLLRPSRKAARRARTTPHD